MTKIQILLGIVLAVFGFENVWALSQYGYIGTWENVINAGFASQLILFDLLIALSLVMVWMWKDARERGVTVWPYLVVTLLTGSIGPLAYLIRRESALKHATAHVTARGPAAQPV